jgi:hypothetical protein
MEIERTLGFEPVDREFDKLGYDIESRVGWYLLFPNRCNLGGFTAV